MSLLASRIVDTKAFRYGVLSLIVFGAVIVGLETSPAIMERWGGLLVALDTIIIAAFTLEALLKIAQHGRRPWRYLLDGWNIFDFAVLVVCLLPLHAHYAAVLRLARVLRTLRLLGALPRLQLLVGALLKSIPSMGYIAGLLFLHFYVYAVVGVFLFRGNDPAHFGDLPTSSLSLFRVVTLEDWTDIMYTQMYGSDVYPSHATGEVAASGPSPVAQPVIGALYFVSFVLFGTMIMLNLFIGVIVNGMADVQREQAFASPSAIDANAELEALEQELANLQDRVRRMRAPPAPRAA